MRPSRCSTWLPAPREDDRVEALRTASKAMLAQGITAYEEALLATTNARVYARLADAGGLAQHVRACMWDRDQTLIAQRHLYARPGLEMGCVKMILDGVPTDSHTAAMLEPYADAAAFGDAARAKGSLLYAPGEIDAKVARYDAAGLVVKLHAAGDGSVSAALDAVAAARKANGPFGPHHEIAHANFRDAGRYPARPRLDRYLRVLALHLVPQPAGARRDPLSRPRTHGPLHPGPRRDRCRGPRGARFGLAGGAVDVAMAGDRDTGDARSAGRRRRNARPRSEGERGRSLAPDDRQRRAPDRPGRQGRHDRSGAASRSRGDRSRHLRHRSAPDFTRPRVLRTIIAGKEAYLAP